MNRKQLIDQTLQWLRLNTDKFGMYECDKFSAMFYFSTHHKLWSSKLFDDYSYNMNRELNHIISKHVINTACVGDMIYLAACWPMIHTVMEKKWTYSSIQEILRAFLLDQQNKMDTIDKLLIYSFIDIEPNQIKTIVQEAIMELSNVRFWKYSLVGTPTYYRKIHNSFHYSTPYMLLYLLSKLQTIHSLLPNYAEKVLEKVMLDAYDNLEQLSILDTGLLLSSTPEKYYHLVDKAMDVYIKKIDQQGFQAIPFYYDNLYFGNHFVGSSAYVVAVVLEALLTAGRFQWHPFVVCENFAGQSKFVSQLEQIDTYNYPKRCRIKMREHCMAPVLEEGDEIEISYDFCNISIDDIVVFRHYDHRVMAHRVIDIITKESKRALITAADNGGLWGYPVFKKDIIGKVVKIYKHE